MPLLVVMDVQTLRPCARERVSVEWDGLYSCSTRYGGLGAIVICADMRILAHVIGSTHGDPLLLVVD